MQENKITWNALSVNTGVVLVVLAIVGVGWGRLEARDFSGPNCIPPATWTWMDNAKSMNPCKTAAVLQGACHGTTFQVSTLQSNSHYTPGNASTADSCYCSWATYNLLSACTLCQDEQNSILSWAQWNSTACANFASTSDPWPPGYNNTIPNQTTFPNWAAKDPRTWTDGRWNGAQASQTAQIDLGDYYLATVTPTQGAESRGGTITGAITGGVVGGVVAFAVGAAVAVFLLLRAKRRRAELEKNRDLDMTNQPMEYHHPHSPSGGLNRFIRSNSGYTPLGHFSSPSNGSMSLPEPSTFVTHISDQQSLAQESLPYSHVMPPSSGPQAQGSLPYSRAMSPSPGPQTQGSSIICATPPPQGTVSPFIRQHPTPSATTHRKKTSEASEGSSIMNENPPQRAFNPPAYSEAPGDRGDFSSLHDGGDQVTMVGSSSIVTTPSITVRPTRHERNVSSTSITSAGSHQTQPSNMGYWIQPGPTSFSMAGGLLNNNDPLTRTISPPPTGNIMSVTRSERQRSAPHAADAAQIDRTYMDV